MARYKKYEHLPWWLSNYNHDTLTPVEKEVLDIDYYCKKFGTKLSHQQVADMLHRSKRAVQLARRRLKELGLRTTEPAKGSFLVGHPIEYQNKDGWLAALRARGIDSRGAMIAPKSSKKKRPLQGLSSSQVSEASAVETVEARVSHPQTPGGLTDRCSGEAEVSEADRQRREKAFRELIYRESLNKFHELELDEDRAKNLAQIRTERKIAERRTWLKFREEKRTEDQRNKNPKLD